MKYLSNKNGFLGIDNEVNFKEKVVVVPFGLEKTVSYGGGTRNGPKEIIKASTSTILFDTTPNVNVEKVLKLFKFDKIDEILIKKFISNLKNLVS